MRFKAWHLQRFVLVGGTLIALGCAPGGAWAQQNGSNNNQQTSASAQFQMQGQGQWQDVHGSDWAALDQFLDSHPDIADALRANPDLIYDQNFMAQHNDFKGFCDQHPGIAQDMRSHPELGYWLKFRREVGLMDRDVFNSHPDIEKELAANPNLIHSQSYLSAHPELQAFIQTHPEVVQAFDAKPATFMNMAARIQVWEGDRYTGANRNGNPYRTGNPNPNGYNANGNANGNGNANTNGNNPNPDLTRGEVASMDQFLDSNPKIAQELEANPSLINNAKYLNDHPALRAFLNDHPQVREEFTENPSYFMQRENQFEKTENGQPDVATMNAYLDKHHDEARDLNAYPARVNDSDYLAHHKDLADFLKKHPNVREEFTHNPSAFMHQESSFDACAQMDDFLDHHKDIAKDLDSNPDNIKDANYLDHHKDLRDFLGKNPGVSDQFHSNPGDFMNRERRFEGDRQMDVYLSNHKGVAKDLQKNPDQVKDANYLDHHKDLKQVLDKNPELAQAANTDPSGFWQEQVKFRENYKNQQVQDKTKVQERATTHGPQ